MKITKKMLERIIKEELENLTTDAGQEERQIDEDAADVTFMNQIMGSLARIEKALKISAPGGTRR